MAERFYIFSVNTFPVQTEAGMFGIYHILPRKPKDRFRRTYIADRPYKKDRGNDVFDDKIESGLAIAQDLVKRNPGLGLFVAAGSEPTEAELQAAESAMREADVLRVRKGDRIWETKRDRAQINEESRNAAKRLSLLREWLDAAPQEQFKECQFCAELVKANAKVCKHCGRDLVPAAAAPPPAAPEPKQPALR